MTYDHDFKKLVRARMAETGQRYTQARADLLADSVGRTSSLPAPASFPEAPAPFRPTTDAYAAARADHERLVGRFFDGERLRSVPTRRKVRASILLELVTRFEPGRRYPEREVNEILGRAHEDFAYLRRELVDYGYLTRADGIYQLATAAPERAPFFRDELPAWEALWLPGYLSGGSRR